MISGLQQRRVRRQAEVDRLAELRRRAAARSAIVDFSTGKFSSVSPPKNVRCATLAAFPEQELDAVARRLLGS